MNESEKLWQRLREKRLIALISPKSAADCVTAFETLDPLGVTLEIALRTPHAIEGIRAVKSAHPDALVLAGTVMTRAQAEAAIDGGVAGVVSADYIPAVVETCVRREILCVPGGLADAGKQLVQKADLLGVDLDTLREKYPCQWVYKLFPAMAGAPVFLEGAASLKAVFKELTIVYAGGVTRDNVAQIIEHDRGAIICGSALMKKIDDPAALREEAEAWLDLIHNASGTVAGPAGQRTHSEAALRQAEGSSTLERPVPPEGSAPPAAGVVTFGEIMLRLSPGKGQRFGQSAQLDATFGGAEANVAAALAYLGRAARFVTALPEHALGQAAVNALRALGVDTTCVARQGDRVGIYFLEQGASQRPSKVIYDRAGSAVSTIAPGDIDWERVFAGARWFHWSGITPALSDSAAAVTADAVRAARAAGCTVSVDLNYRSKLWSRQKARDVMTPLMECVDVAIGNEQDAADVFGIEAGASDTEAGTLDISGYEHAARTLHERFGLKMAAITLRESLSASDNNWSACLFDGEEFFLSRKYAIHVVDRVGGGDAFSAGLIHGLLSAMSPAEALEFAVAASCLKQTIAGDFNRVTRNEVEALAGGDATGRIKR